MRYTRLRDEPEAYVVAREELRAAEASLLQQRERVAELRRSLPKGAPVGEYVFLEGPADLDAGDEPVNEVRLSELVGPAGRALIVFQLMYGKAQTHPCPMCSMWLDGLNGVVDHVGQNADLLVVAAAALPELRAHGRDRGWDRLRLLSAGASSFKFDLGSEDEDGGQTSAVSVFDRDATGAIFHTYTAHPQWSDTDHQRGLDLLSPVWNLLDLTPHGRGDWYASLTYDGQEQRG